MGWVAGAGCFVIACMILYKWLSNTSIVEHKKTASKSQSIHDSNIHIKKDTDSTKIVRFAPTITEPSFRLTAEDSSTAPTIQVNVPSIEQPTQEAMTSRDIKIMPPPPPSVVRAPPNPSSPPRLKPPSFGAPPRPGGTTLRPPPSAASSLRVPQTKVLQNTSMAPSLMAPPQKKKSKAVTLEPGHSPLDWAALTSDPRNNLRGKDAPDNLIRITPSQLKTQNGRKGRDVWTVYQGKVYNISPYVPFHPGGKGEILRGAGKDSATLFNEAHPWVNWDGMLKECMVGMLVAEDEGGTGNDLDEMD